MNTRRRLGTPRFELILLLGCLASCGGGSSSSSSSGPSPIQEPPAPTITYTGSRQPVVVTQANVAQLALAAFSLRAISQNLESLWIDAPPGPFKDQQTQTGQFGGTVRLRAEIGSNGRGFVEAIFQNFSDSPGEVINGKYVQRFRPETGAPGNIDFSFAGPGNLEFDNLTITVDQLVITLVGVIRIAGFDSDSFQVDLIVSDNLGGGPVYYENCSLQFSEVVVRGGPRPAVDIDGAVYNQGQGGFEFSSLGPIPDLGFNEFAGYLVAGAGGGIEMTANGPVTHVRAISFAFASIIMDLDGDGTPETAKRFSWPQLAGEIVVESSVMQGPIANAGNWRTPESVTPVKVHGLFSHDDDGDWLTFEWRLLAKPPMSAVSIDNISTRPYFEFTPDIPGDYLFGVRVSDGITASKTSVVIRNAPERAGNDENEPAGGLEIGPPIAAATPMIIDGRSAMNWPYSQTRAFWNRTGFGFHSFGDTGDPASTYLTLTSEGLSEVRFTHGSEFVGAANSSTSISLAVGPTIFETTIDLAGEANAVDVHKLDYDGDGDQDLAMRTGPPGTERILILSSTTEGLVFGANVAAGSGEIAHGDVNGDGLADFLNATDNGLLLFTQLPDHSLSAPLPIAYPPMGCAESGGQVDIALDNIDDAGRLDLIAVHPCGNAIVGWLQQTDGSLVAQTLISFPNHRIESADFGDVNSDGRTDVIATLIGASSAYSSGVAVLVSQTDNTYAEEYFVERTGFDNVGGTVGDIDGDNRNDVVITNDDDIILLRQQVNNTFDSSVIYSDPAAGLFQSTVAVIDLDGDGSKDIYFCGTAPNKRLLLQQPGGTFKHVFGPRCLHMTMKQPVTAVSFDWDNDGSNDLVTITRDSRGVSDGRALLKVHLQNVHSYPVTD